MKKTQKWILGSVLTIIIAFSGSIAAWFILSGNQPPGEDSTYPDLIIADTIIENDYLTINITNIGDTSATSVTIIVKIDSLSLTLYNNTNSPIDLDINEDFIFSISLLDFEHHFVSFTTYNINIQVDPDDGIEEIFEDNNEQIIEYYYEENISPPPDLFLPNTFSLNCSINDFGYAVQFNTSQVLLENSLNITNGKINGYNLVNSSILENCSITTDIYQITIALYGNQNFTIRNLWDDRLNFLLSDNSSISLLNCSLQNLYIAGSNDVYIWNSSINMISTSNSITDLSSLRIKNNSTIEILIISTQISLEIDFSSLRSLYILVSKNPYSQEGDYLVFGSIKNCTIYHFLAFSQTNLNFYGTDIYQISVIGKSRLNFLECIITEGSVQQNSVAIFNKTKVLSTLTYGIKISSGSVNLTNGIIEGNYENTTILINSNVSKMILSSVFINNTGQVFVSNFTCIFFLYDYANLIINETGIEVPNEYGGYFDGFSTLTAINTTFNTIYSQQNSSLNLSEGCMVGTLLANNSNTININNCIFDDIAWYSDMKGARKAKIINSSVGNFIAPLPSKLDIINCSIDMLYEGIEFQSGINYLNSSGYSGDGVVLNSLNITNSMISNRTYKYIKINGAAEVKLNNLHEYIIIVAETGNSTITNCTIESLEIKNNSIMHLNNCSTPDSGGFGSMISILLGPPSFICMDNSNLCITNSTIHDGFILILQNSSQTTIKSSAIYGIYIYEYSRAEIISSEVWTITVAASYSSSYALNISYSVIDTLSTIGWKYS